MIRSERVSASPPAPQEPDDAHGCGWRDCHHGPPAPQEQAAADLKTASEISSAAPQEQAAAQRDDLIELAQFEAQKHLPDERRGGCTCGFCAWSVEHVLVMSMRWALDLPASPAPSDAATEAQAAKTPCRYCQRDAYNDDICDGCYSEAQGEHDAQRY